MKRPCEVGGDFDEYARRWQKESYQLEAGGGAGGVLTDPSRAGLVQWPGDEWGDVAPLRRSYADLITRYFPGSGPLNVLEIGAGGGRSTAVMLDVLGQRASQYHVVDVSAGLVEVLKERIDRPIDVHIVDDVDLSGVPKASIDLCLAQSSWSHINLYDQYRYLRELRRVLRPGGLVYVSGQFLLGVANDWTWNRFKNRVGKVERGAFGEIFHEFTSVSALAEMLIRLQYRIVCINGSGFVAKRPRRYFRDGLGSLTGPVEFPFNPSAQDFLATGRAQTIRLPAVGAAGDIRASAPRSSRRAATTRHWRRRLRTTIADVPGARALVRRIRHATGSLSR